MTSGPPSESSKTGYAPNESRRATALPPRFEEPFARQLQRNADRDPWGAVRPSATLRYAHTYPGSVPTPNTQPLQSLPPQSNTVVDRSTTPFSHLLSPQAPRWSRDECSTSTPPGFYDIPSLSLWPNSPLLGQQAVHTPMTPGNEISNRGGYGWQGPWPGPLLRRTSSDEAPLGGLGANGYDAGGNPSFQTMGKSYPQRRPSNRDEFDGPSQLLDKPEDIGYEPKEEDLPQLPITLYAQEQDEILSKVNDRLSQCAFDFVAKYQFPIPIEPDKRPVRVPGDREWSEWVYLLKRLATKRRIPARVLYNGQIKQLITILENSLEMRHAAKHQSRPLKDDRNILQLISSGLQVAKILKDAPAMQYLDNLYAHTERLIQSRRSPPPSSTSFGS